VIASIASLHQNSTFSSTSAHKNESDDNKETVACKAVKQNNKLNDNIDDNDCNKKATDEETMLNTGSNCNDVDGATWKEKTVKCVTAKQEIANFIDCAFVFFCNSMIRHTTTTGTMMI